MMQDGVVGLAKPGARRLAKVPISEHLPVHGLLYYPRTGHVQSNSIKADPTAGCNAVGNIKGH